MTYDPSGLNDEEFSNFCATPEFIAAAPAGKMDLLGTGTVYVDGAGLWLSSDDYMARHNGADPEVMWRAVKRYRAMVGSEKAVQILSPPTRAKIQPVKLGKYCDGGL